MESRNLLLINLFAVLLLSGFTYIDVYARDSGDRLTVNSKSLKYRDTWPVASKNVSGNIEEGKYTDGYSISAGSNGDYNKLKIAAGSGNVIDGGFASGQTYTVEPTAPAEGFASVTALAPLPIHTNLGDQSQSKVWKHEGKWWAVVPAPSAGTHLWRLDGTAWAKVLRLSSASNTRSDCKVIGNTAHILLYRGANYPAQLVSLEFDPASATYQLWSRRRAIADVGLDAGVETAALDVDGSGRMWVVSDAPTEIRVRWSDAPYTTWSAPVTVATGVKDDDQAAIIAMPAAGKVGVLWSDQNRKRFGFKTHADGAAPSEWSADEVPASQSAADNNGAGMADDHLNMAIASDGTLYCAVKTGYKSGSPVIALLVRRPSGAWDNLYEVAAAGNRPIVVLNEAAGKVKVVYAAPSAGGIYYRESPVSGISFGSEMGLIAETCDYATSLKDPYSPDVVIMASTNTTAYSVLATDNTTSNMGISIASTSNASSLPATEQDLSKGGPADFYIYPNPSPSHTKISFILDKTGDYFITLLDSKGVKVTTIGQSSATAGALNTIDTELAEFPSGLYFVRLQTSTTVKTLRLMLSK